MKYKLDIPIYGRRNNAFCSVSNLKVSIRETCKEEFLALLKDYGYSKDRRLSVGFYYSYIESDVNLNVLNSFAKEFGLPETSISYCDPDNEFCVVKVPIKWRRNNATLGLFLSLFRASILHPASSWKKLNYETEISELKKCRPNRIKALWSNQVDLLIENQQSEAESCMYYLTEFETRYYLEDMGIEANNDNLPIIQAGLWFDKQ